MEVDEDSLQESTQQLCRLCGQYESMYVDVFGDEGTKRLLNLKIHSKINILIEHDDGLPQTICMRCLGTLEFLCDFHEMCHRTQAEFQETLRVNKNLTSLQSEPDPESDKENVLPHKAGKRKAKPIQSEVSKIAKVTEAGDVQSQEIVHSSNREEVEKSVPEIGDKAPENPDKELKDSFPKKSSDRSYSNDARDKAHQQPEAEPDKTVVELKIPESVTGQAIESIKITTNKDGLEEDHVVLNLTPDMQQILNSPGNQSIIVPLNVENFSNPSTGNGPQIVHEIYWFSNDNGVLTEPQKPKSSTLQENCINASPPPGDEAETKADSSQASQELILLELQVPTKETAAPSPPPPPTAVPVETQVAPVLPKIVPEAIRRVRSSSSVSTDRRSSEGKYAKMSELMTDEQKKTIENFYRIDMSVIDDRKVTAEVVVLDKSKFKCKICNQTYTRLDKCQVHVWRHLDMKPYFCKACDYTTLTVSNIRCHIRKSHLKIKPFECHICKKSYTSATQLEEHLNTHTGSRPYECANCNFASTSKQVLAHHVLTHKNEKDISCDICGKAFYSKGRMRAHRIIHNKEKAFKCSLCSTYVIHQQALEKHYENVHSRDYKCKICGKAYKSGKALRNHENVHSEAKYKCPMCPNIYKSSHILKEHILKHQGIRQYKCDRCNKSFAQQSHLAAHMAVHSGISYNCPGCQKGFNRHDNMKVHANRCERFLSNPSLKDLLVKRKISFSKNDTAKINSASQLSSSMEKVETKRAVTPDTPKENVKVISGRVQKKKSVINKVKMDAYISNSSFEQDSISLNGNAEESSVIEHELTSEQF